jgi:hypothetical protein
MKRLIVILLGVSAPFFSYAQQTLKGVPSPESIAAYKGGYFVSSMGQKPAAMDKDGDGAIAFIDKTGKLQSAKYFAETLNAPKGIDISGNKLYVADIDHVKGFDINTKKKIFDLNLEGEAKLLNDVFVIDDGTLIVSDSFTGDILKINLKNGTYDKIGLIPAANGVAYDKKTDMLYVCSMGEQMNAKGKLYAKKLKGNDGNFTEVANSPVGLFDGIVLVNGEIILSDWLNMSDSKVGNLVIYDPATKTYKRKEVSNSPADIALDKSNNKLLIPVMMKSEIDIVSLDK